LATKVISHDLAICRAHPASPVRDQSGVRKGIRDRGLLELPFDPWGHPYHYRSPGIHNLAGFDAWSVGPDGVDESADDIGNWK
jgi:hypothetical protein